MSYSILEQLKSRIDTTTPIILGDIPDKPDNIIVLNQNVGFITDESMDVASLRDKTVYCTVSVLGRVSNVTGSYNSVIDALDEIVDEITALIGYTVEDKFICDVISEQIDYNGKDEKNRHLASVNLNIMYSR